jgi:hypothetical protein
MGLVCWGGTGRISGVSNRVDTVNRMNPWPVTGRRQLADKVAHANRQIHSAQLERYVPVCSGWR